MSRITVRMCIRAVAQHYRLSEQQLLERTRRHAIAHPRQVAMYLCTQLTEASLPDIGQRFVGRVDTGNGQFRMEGFDHTTVMYARDRIKARLADDLDLRSDIDKITKALRAMAAEAVPA